MLRIRALVSQLAVDIYRIAIDKIAAPITIAAVVAIAEFPASGDEITVLRVTDVLAILAVLA